MNPVGLILVAAGVFSMLGAICNWEWFMNARKARFMVKILTRNGARIFYGILGLALVVLGVLATMGIIDMSK
jgi:predicted small integral membrane protein